MLIGWLAVGNSETSKIAQKLRQWQEITFSSAFCRIDGTTIRGDSGEVERSLRVATSQTSSHSTTTFKICWLCEPAFLKVKFVKVINTVRKQNTVENFNCANFMSNSVTCGSTSLGPK